ncbi:galactose-1-phosphate uridyl transferase, partial [Nowakowskiella sp. JEL0078]
MCVVPFWAVWPFETLIISKSHLPNLPVAFGVNGNRTDEQIKQQTDFAAIIRGITAKYDNLFRCSFPYSMGIHQSPCDGDQEKQELSHFH